QGQAKGGDRQAGWAEFSAHRIYSRPVGARRRAMPLGTWAPGHLAIWAYGACIARQRAPTAPREGLLAVASHVGVDDLRNRGIGMGQLLLVHGGAESRLGGGVLRQHRAAALVQVDVDR